MAANTSPIFIEAPKNAAVTFVNADGTTAKTLLTAGADGSKISRIGVVSDDTSSVLLKLYIRISGTDYWIGSYSVVTLSGTNGTASAKNILDTTLMPWLDAAGEFPLGASLDLKIAPNAAVTSGKTVTITAYYGDY